MNAFQSFATSGGYEIEFYDAPKLVHADELRDYGFLPDDMEKVLRVPFLAKIGDDIGSFFYVTSMGRALVLPADKNAGVMFDDMADSDDLMELIDEMSRRFQFAEEKPLPSLDDVLDKIGAQGMAALTDTQKEVLRKAANENARTYSSLDDVADKIFDDVDGAAPGSRIARDYSDIISETPGVTIEGLMSFRDTVDAGLRSNKDLRFVHVDMWTDAGEVNFRVHAYKMDPEHCVGGKCQRKKTIDEMSDGKMQQFIPLFEEFNSYYDRVQEPQGAYMNKPDYRKPAEMPMPKDKSIRWVYDYDKQEWYAQIDGPVTGRYFQRWKERNPKPTEPPVNESLDCMFEELERDFEFEDVCDVCESEVKRTENGISYRGETFPGYNKPKKYSGPGKFKKRVLAKEGDKIKVLNFGHKDYEDYTQHGDADRRKNFRSRMQCDKGKLSKLTKRYWACQHLW